MTSWEGYFDESGSFEEDPKIFCISGYFLEEEKAKAMDAEWEKVLNHHKIPYFHMVDCAHGNGVFKNIARDERDQIVRKLIALIKKYTLCGFSFVAKEDQYMLPDGTPDIYSALVSTCVDHLDAFRDFCRIKSDVAYFFEAGHKNKGSAYNHIARKLADYSSSLTFGDKQKVRLLQAADLLAWQSTKFAKDQHYSKKRPARKDFLSLMEHHHDILFITLEGETKFTVVDTWPLGRRGSNPALLEFHREGPITYYTENGVNIPIIQVMSTKGYAEGSGKDAYIVFDGLDNKVFALAFNEYLLMEAALILIQAKKIYGQSEPSINITASDVSLISDQSECALKINMPNGTNIRFKCPREALLALKDALNKI
ncbi:MAG: DUF3800 domain-containing protein [Alphaproteobacteria bacterium]|nr:DUF3800 domain-containing protein [Alphaproteobacteria bacterium]